MDDFSDCNVFWKVGGEAWQTLMAHVKKTCHAAVMQKDVVRPLEMLMQAKNTEHGRMFNSNFGGGRHRGWATQLANAINASRRATSSSSTALVVGGPVQLNPNAQFAENLRSLTKTVDVEVADTFGTPTKKSARCLYVGSAKQLQAALYPKMKKNDKPVIPSKLWPPVIGLNAAAYDAGCEKLQLYIDQHAGHAGELIKAEDVMAEMRKAMQAKTPFFKPLGNHRGQQHHYGVAVRRDALYAGLFEAGEEEMQYGVELVKNTEGFWIFGGKRVAFDGNLARLFPQEAPPARARAAPEASVQENDFAACIGGFGGGGGGAVIDVVEAKAVHNDKGTQTPQAVEECKAPTGDTPSHLFRFEQDFMAKQQELLAALARGQFPNMNDQKARRSLLDHAKVRTEAEVEFLDKNWEKPPPQTQQSRLENLHRPPCVAEGDWKSMPLAAKAAADQVARALTKDVQAAEKKFAEAHAAVEAAVGVAHKKAYDEGFKAGKKEGSRKRKSSAAAGSAKKKAKGAGAGAL